MKMEMDIESLLQAIEAGNVEDRLAKIVRMRQAVEAFLRTLQASEAALRDLAGQLEAEMGRDGKISPTFEQTGEFLKPCKELYTPVVVGGGGPEKKGHVTYPEAFEEEAVGQSVEDVED